MHVTPAARPARGIPGGLMALGRASSCAAVLVTGRFTRIAFVSSSQTHYCLQITNGPGTLQGLFHRAGTQRPAMQLAWSVVS